MLDWQDGQPFSRRFGDVYFSRDSGLAEKRYTFLQGNRLAERFAVLIERRWIRDRRNRIRHGFELFMRVAAV